MKELRMPDKKDDKRSHETKGTSSGQGGNTERDAQGQFKSTSHSGGGSHSGGSSSKK
jgi:hypothetical protein